MKVTEAFERYKSVYGDACRNAEGLYREYLNPDMPLELGLATKGDIQIAQSWSGGLDHNRVERLPPNGGWNWPDLYEGQRKNTKAYCIAMRSDGELGGLLLGGISKGKNVVSIHYLEGAVSQTALSSNLVNIAVNLSALVATHSEINAKYLAVYEPNERMRARLMDPSSGFSNMDLFGYRVKSCDISPLYRELHNFTL